YRRPRRVWQPARRRAGVDHLYRAPPDLPRPLDLPPARLRPCHGHDHALAAGGPAPAPPANTALSAPARDPDTSAPLLSVERLTMRFGGLVAVNDVSFQARDRAITAIIGPNGAGKTTVFNCLTGFYKPTQGMLRLVHPANGETYLLER